MGQTIVNLDTGEEYNDSQWKNGKYQGSEFCWAAHYLSPDGNTLAVDGCHWACPYEIKFYDFTDPSKGWPELELEGDYVDTGGEKESGWNEDGTFSAFRSTRVYKPLGKREWEIEEDEIPDEEYDNDDNWEDVDDVRSLYKRYENRMTLVEKYESEEEIQRQKNQAESDQKFDAWQKVFYKEDPLYTIMLSEIERLKLNAEDYNGFRHLYNDESREISRRVCSKFGKKKLTADLRWGAKEGPIKLDLFENGKSLKEKPEFAHSPSAMKEAFQYIESRLAR
jgi:hypothetical protein